MACCVVVPAGLVATVPHTSQSPAVKEIDVTFAGVPEVNETAEPTRIVEEIYSPILPAFALLFVVVPTIPEVWLGVIVPVALIVVKAPLAGVVNPIDEGDANMAVIPGPEIAPLTVNVPLLVRVVKLPAAAAVVPIGVLWIEAKEAAPPDWLQQIRK
jgi:hypothetical protein